MKNEKGGRWVLQELSATEGEESMVCLSVCLKLHYVVRCIKKKLTSERQNQIKLLLATLFLHS